MQHESAPSPSLSTLVVDNQLVAPNFRDSMRKARTLSSEEQVQSRLTTINPLITPQRKKVLDDNKINLVLDARNKPTSPILTNRARPIPKLTSKLKDFSLKRDKSPAPNSSKAWVIPDDDASSDNSSISSESTFTTRSSGSLPKAFAPILLLPQSKTSNVPVESNNMNMSTITAPSDKARVLDRERQRRFGKRRSRPHEDRDFSPSNMPVLSSQIQRSENTNNVNSNANANANFNGNSSPAKNRSPSPPINLNNLAMFSKLNEQPAPVANRRERMMRRGSLNASPTSIVNKSSPTRKMTLSWTESQKKARALNQTGNNHFRSGRYNEAINAFGDALRVAKSDITSIREHDNDHHEDEDIDENHHSHEDTHLGSNVTLEQVILLSQTLNAIGVVHWRNVEIDEALHSLQDAWAVENKSLKKTMSSCGLYMNTNDGNQGYSTLIDSTLLACKVTTLTNLGIVHKMKKEWETALNFISDALVMQRRLDNLTKNKKDEDNFNPMSNDDVGNSRNSISSYSKTMAMIMGIKGVIYQAKKDYEAALKTQTFALQVKRHLFRDKPNQPSLAVTLLSVGSLLLETKQNLDYAVEVFQEALDIQRVTLSPSNVDIGVTWHYLARVNVLKEDYKAANQQFKEANRVYEKAGLEDKYIIKAALWKDMADMKMKTWRSDVNNIQTQSALRKNNPLLQYQRMKKRGALGF